MSFILLPFVFEEKTRSLGLGLGGCLVVEGETEAERGTESGIEEGLAKRDETEGGPRTRERGTRETERLKRQVCQKELREQETSVKSSDRRE